MTVVHSELKTDHLIKRHDYFVKVKASLMASMVGFGKSGYLGSILGIFNIIRFCMKHPEPTKENCTNPDSWVLLDIWDEFFELENNPGRNPLFRAMRRLSVAILESIDYYSERMTWFLMKLSTAYIDGKWKPNLPCCPFSCWKDPATIEAGDKAIEDFLMGQAETLYKEEA